MAELSEQQYYPPLSEAQPEDLSKEATQQIAEMLATKGVDPQLFKRLRNIALGLLLAGGMTLMAACGEKTVVPQVSAKTPIVEEGSLPSQGLEQELVITATPSWAADIIQSTLVPPDQEEPQDLAQATPTSEESLPPTQTPTSTPIKIVVQSGKRNSNSSGSSVTVSTLTPSPTIQEQATGHDEDEPGQSEAEKTTPTSTPINIVVQSGKRNSNSSGSSVTVSTLTPSPTIQEQATGHDEDEPGQSEAEKTPEQVEVINVKSSDSGSSSTQSPTPVASDRARVDQTEAADTNPVTNEEENQWTKEWAVNETIPLKTWWDDMISKGYIQIDSIAWRYAGDQINSLIDDSNLVPNPDEFWKTGRGFIGNCYSELQKLESDSRGHIEVRVEAYHNIPGGRNCDLFRSQ